MAFMGELVSCGSHRMGQKLCAPLAAVLPQAVQPTVSVHLQWTNLQGSGRVKLQEAGSCGHKRQDCSVSNTMAIGGNAAVADFAKGVETEIIRVNENAAKRGK